MRSAYATPIDALLVVAPDAILCHGSNLLGRLPPAVIATIARNEVSIDERS